VLRSVLPQESGEALADVVQRKEGNYSSHLIPESRVTLSWAARSPRHLTVKHRSMCYNGSNLNPKTLDEKKLLEPRDDERKCVDSCCVDIIVSALESTRSFSIPSH